MKCPSCGTNETAVIDSRVTREGREIRRRRACEVCAYRFTTYERAEERVVWVTKKDGQTEPLSLDKITIGMVKACEKLGISGEQIEAAARRIVRAITDRNEEKISSEEVGRYVMEALYDLDEVAYIRFASVYFRFRDIIEFTRHVEQIRRKRKIDAAGKSGKSPKADDLSGG